MSKDAIREKGEPQWSRVYPNAPIGGNIPGQGLVTRSGDTEGVNTKAGEPLKSDPTKGGLHNRRKT